MKILVTGGAGFIGSAVVRLALAKGHSVVNIDKLTYASCLANLKGVAHSPRYSFVQADICDASALAMALHTHRPNAVIHLAAESHVDRSIDGPKAFVDTNIIGTYTLLEATRSYWEAAGKSDTFRFLHVSTDEVFGSLGDDGSFDETTPYAPRSPYSATKAASDHLVQAWHSTYGLPTLVTNCSNNYGPFQFPEKLVPVAILNAIAGRPIPIYGSGHQVRDWLYVDDHAAALLKILMEAPTGSTYAIGGDNQISNLELVNKICEILDRILNKNTSHQQQIEHVADRPGHDQRYAIDATRLRSHLGWAPMVSFDEGLAKTVRWYLDNEAWWRALQQLPSLDQRLGLAV